MTPEQQQIAIAEACGWKCIKTDWDYFRYTKVLQGVSPINVSRGFDGSKECHFWQLPDYLNDLNAMHEAEKLLTEKQKEDYPINLARVIRHQLGIDNSESIYHWKFSTFATASQRAEVLIKTLGLWNP